jgi:ABC-2 type transport system permease protein
MNLVRGELLKVRTTNMWWILAIAAFVLQALAFAINALQAHILLDPANAGNVGDDPTAIAATGVTYQVANLYTSGQFLALLFVMLLGILLVTNEYHHQTATTTFLTTPHRTMVILSKLVAAVILGTIYWLASTLINIAATVVFLSTEHIGNHLGDSAISKAILLNLLAYTLWGIFGVGFGVLIRSQIGATVTAIVLYLAGTLAANILVAVLVNALHWDWVNKAQVVIPSIASSLMISGTELPGNPPQWLGAVVLVAYAVVTGAVGTLIVRTRDIS